MQSLSLTTSQTQYLSVHLFEPEISNQKLLLINSATGVKQQTYWKFAQYFCDQGFTVMTYDYYGIGLSKPKNLKHCNASMRTWGAVDYKALTDFIQQNYPSYQKYVLGHSVGALILGMNEDSKIFEKLIFVATQKAYIGNLDLKTKISSILGFGLVQPILTQVLGYFPGQKFGLGESLPKAAANDWRALILNPKSTNRLLEKIQDFSKTLTQETLVVSAEDDPWVTQKGMDTLLSETYPHLKPRFIYLKTSESPENHIGHINFFRSFNQKLWDVVLDFIK